MIKLPKTEGQSQARHTAKVMLIVFTVVGGTGGVLFALWLLKTIKVWTAYVILCGIFALSTWRMFRSFEILLFVGLSCGIGALIANMPKIPHFGHYGIGAFAGIVTVAMIAFELERLFRKGKQSGAGGVIPGVED